MISIIMPTLNEERNIEGAIQNVSKLKGDFEFIVVDGGSTDRTREIAKKYTTVIASSDKGRAKQMNAGAIRAKGDVLLFLHADCQLPPHALSEIERSLNGKGYNGNGKGHNGSKEIVGGAFKFYLDDYPSPFKLLSSISNLRASISKTFTGDFGLFIRKSTFDKIGGFNEIELMEDVDICKRLKKEGKLVQADAKIISSARRFKKQGLLKTWTHMQINRFLYFIGVSPKRLSEFYKEVR